MDTALSVLEPPALPAGLTAPLKLAATSPRRRRPRPRRQPTPAIFGSSRLGAARAGSPRYRPPLRRCVPSWPMRRLPEAGQHARAPPGRHSVFPPRRWLRHAHERREGQGCAFRHPANDRRRSGPQEGRDRGHHHRHGRDRNVAARAARPRGAAASASPARSAAPSSSRSTSPTLRTCPRAS